MADCYNYGIVYGKRKYYTLRCGATWEDKFNAHDVSTYAVLMMRDAIKRRMFESYEHARANFVLYFKSAFAHFLRAFKSQKVISLNATLKISSDLTIEEYIGNAINHQDYYLEQNSERCEKVKTIFKSFPKQEQEILIAAWVVGETTQAIAQKYKRSTKYVERLLKENKNKIARKMINVQC